MTPVAKTPRTYDPDKHCGARNRTGNADGRCTLTKGWGTDHTGTGHCKFHGGGSPNGNKHARTELANNILKTALAEAYGENIPDIDPAEAMLQAVSWKYAECLAIRRQLATIDDDDLVWGITKEKQGGEDYGTTKEAKPNIWWSMLQTAEDQLVKYAAAARAAKCDERRVQIARDTGAMLAGAIQQILAALHLTDDQRALVPTVVPGVLRSLSPAAGEGSA